MSEPKDGGPAFPVIPLQRQYLTAGEIEPGMSLLDWFAGQALAGLLAFPGMLNAKGDKRSGETATIAYDFAAAMLREKAKRQT